MRIGNLANRAVLVEADRAVDIHTASNGRFGPDSQGLFDEWDNFTDWARTATAEGTTFELGELRAPVPAPRQVFAIGINYREHADEAGYPTDSVPVTFTKFPTCITGPNATVELPADTVDWEVELVVAISRRAWKISREDAWQHIAGLTVGQDLSERTLQLSGGKPQFSLGKSYPGFGPTGPWLVTPEEFDSVEDLDISCTLSGEVMQHSRTSQMIYGIPDLVASISQICPLLPGDIIFTGTPSGVGNARTPKRFIQPGEILESTVEGIGTLITHFISAK